MEHDSSSQPLCAKVSESMIPKALVVGMFMPCMASLIRYSLILERKTARPSPLLEYLVIPEPFVCKCHLFTLPKFIALPSPNCGTK